MIERFAGYPPNFGEAIGRFCANPLGTHTRIAESRNRISDQTGSDNRRVFRRERLHPQDPVWVTAIIESCVFVAGVTRSRENPGEISAGGAGHFSAWVPPFEVERLLGDLGASLGSRLFFAGMSRRSSPETLGAATRSLVDLAGKFGVPLSLYWEEGREDRPVLVDETTGLTVSDIGLGLSSARSREVTISRWVSFGVSSAHSLVVSTVLEKRAGQRLMPTTTHFLTEESGLLAYDHTQTRWVD